MESKSISELLNLNNTTVNFKENLPSPLPSASFFPHANDLNNAECDPDEDHIKPRSDVLTIDSTENPNEEEVMKPLKISSLKYTITADRLAALRKVVETAVAERKVFTIRGYWPVIRNELLKRGWVEKIDTNSPKPKTPPQQMTTTNSSAPPEDIISNLPRKQSWETTATYAEKCERTIKSRMLIGFEADFYWCTRRDQCDNHHRTITTKMMSRFGRTLFASKEGLALLLQQHSAWNTEPNVAHVNFPRCYVLGFPDHYSHLVDDFRTTACRGVLHWLVDRSDQKKSLRSDDGRGVPLSTINFALDRCVELIESRKHLDLDKTYPRVYEYDWDQFLNNYYKLVHQGLLLSDEDVTIGTPNSVNLPIQLLCARAKKILLEIGVYCPEYKIDGFRNIWIVKPGNKCRGRGIHLVKTLADIDKIVGLKLKYVVQKYIEKPFLIYNTKFDIRQWFIVASSQPLVIWMYRESYLRFSSQMFNLDNFHESLHLTNHAVQCKYSNMEQRDKALPSDNMWDCYTFQTHLRELGYKDKWAQVVYPGMRESIICAMLSSQEVMDRRQNTFELYGADFMLDDELVPWLIEINCSPDLSPSTSVTSRMCPQCMQDLIKVVVDRKRDPNAFTGRFDLVYKQNLPRIPPYLGTNLLVRGRKISRNNRHYSRPKTMDIRDHLKTTDGPTNNLQQRRPPTMVVKNTSGQQRGSSGGGKEIGGGDIYKGPVIGDLIDDLRKAFSIFGIPDPNKIDASGKRPKRDGRRDRIKRNKGRNPH